MSTWLTSGPIAIKTTLVTACANPLMACAAGFALWHLYNAWCNYDENTRLGHRVEQYEYGGYLMQPSKYRTCFEQFLTYLST